MMKKDYLDALGIKESGLQKLIEASYSLLGLISFNSGREETRHGLLREVRRLRRLQEKYILILKEVLYIAEVVAYDDLIKCGGFNQAKEKGLVRSEGKDYVMQDGDVVLFRFNV